MTTQQDFLDTILADPDDDTARLVYADWLDENEESVACEKCNDGKIVDPTGGYREFSGSYPTLQNCGQCSGSGRVSNGYAVRAEFIRIGCELSSMQSAVISRLYEKSNDPDPLVQQHATMGLRQKELFDTNAPKWFVGPLMGMIPQVNVMLHATQTFGSGSSVAVVERGFVESVSCPWAAWRDHGDAILSKHPVTKVRLTTEPEIETRSSDSGRRLGIVRLDDEKSEWSRMPGGNNRVVAAESEPTSVSISGFDFIASTKPAELPSSDRIIRRARAVFAVGELSSNVNGAETVGDRLFLVSGTLPNAVIPLNATVAVSAMSGALKLGFAPGTDQNHRRTSFAFRHFSHVTSPPTTALPIFAPQRARPSRHFDAGRRGM